MIKSTTHCALCTPTNKILGYAEVDAISRQIMISYVIHYRYDKIK